MRARWLRDRRIVAVAAGTAVLLSIGAGLIGAYTWPGQATDDGHAALGDGGAGAVNLNATPSPGATRSARPTPSRGAPTRGPAPAQTTAAPSFPKTTDAYATAVLNAWKGHDEERLGQLATPGALTLMGKAPSGLAGGWEFYECWFEQLDPCRELRNDAGDVFGVKVDPAKLGKAKAVTGVWIDFTKYKTTPMDYVYYVIDTWAGEHNDERLATLTDGQAIRFFSGMKAWGDHTAYKDFVTFASGTDPNRVCISAYDTSPQSAGWHFGVDKRRLGKKHAVVFANGSETVPFC